MFLWWDLSRLRSKEAEARRRAAISLGLLKQRAAIGPLIDALVDEDQSVRANALGALDTIDPAWKTSELASAAVAKFIDRLSNSDAKEAYVTAIALADIGDTRAILPLAQKLVEVVATTSTSLSFAVHPESLGRINVKWYQQETVWPVIQRLFEMMRSENTIDRLHAANLLSYIPVEDTQKALVPALHDPAFSPGSRYLFPF